MICPEQIEIFSFGYASLQTSWWLDNVNGTNLMDRLYYFFDSGVSCRAGEQLVHFVPGRFYLLPSNLPLFFSLDPEKNVRQFYVDFYLPEVSFGRKIFEAREKSVMDGLFCFLESYLQKHRISGIVVGNREKQVSDMLRLELAVFLSLLNEQEPIFQEGDCSLSSVVSYMQKHYKEELSLEALCKISALSKNQLIRNFQKTYHITPYQYLKQFRMNMASTRISAGEPIARVAEEVGFSSVSAFSNAFKKFYGDCPSDTKRRNGLL